MELPKNSNSKNKASSGWKAPEGFFENMVDHPDHYKGNKFEVIDVINDYKLNFELGNAIKYILRADKKANKKQDIQKAIWYLNHELSKCKE